MQGAGLATILPTRLLGTVLDLRTTTSQKRVVVRGGFVFKVHGLFVSLNSRRESNKEEERLHTTRDRA